MSFENQTVSSHYARAIVAAAENKGYDPIPLLQTASINPGILGSDDMRITSQQLADLTREAWRVEDDEFLSMAARSCRHGTFTLMAKQAVHCRNLRAVYRHLCRFYSLVTDAIELEFTIDNEQAHLSMKLSDPTLDRDHMLVDFLLLLWHRFPAWLIGKRIPLQSVQFDFPCPQHAKEYRLLFPCPAYYYDQPLSGFTFPAEVLSLPVVQTPDTLREHLIRAPLDWFQKQNYYPTYTRLVLDALTADDTFNNLQIDEIAAAMAMTSRTLRRKLADEKTSFQEIKNLARRDTAIQLLSQRHIPIATIAHDLGYTEAASFCRAFKEWTGVTPQVYKQ